MQQIKLLRKELHLSQKSVAEYLKMDLGNYSKLEKEKWKPKNINKIKKQILFYFVLECNSEPKLTAKMVGINKGNFSRYMKEGRSFNEVIENQKKERIKIKKRVHEILETLTIL